MPRTGGSRLGVWWEADISVRSLAKGYGVEALLQDALTRELGVLPVAGYPLTEFYPGAEPGASLAILEKVVDAWLAGA